MWSDFHFCLILSDVFYNPDGLNTSLQGVYDSHLQLLHSDAGVIRLYFETSAGSDSTDVFVSMSECLDVSDYETLISE